MKQDKKFSFIIPYTTRDKMKVKRAEHSIHDQEYKNVEIVTVHDRDGKGAPWARNQGAERATGDYFFFFDADCVLAPGALVQLKATWEDEPDADFIYGQYRFFGKDGTFYPSRAWNPYVLESMNYISTMSPMKRELFEELCGFNEDLEWFQDWDFFLRAARLGRRGKLLKTILFHTDPQDEKSISGNPKTPYWEKVRYIQSLNGIDRKPICVTTFGAPYQAEYRAQILGADYLGSNMQTDLAWMPGLWGEHDYDMIYIMGFYPTAVEAHMKMFEGARESCKKVIHWIGTDVYQLRSKFPWNAIQALKEDILSQVDYQFTTSDVLTAELAEIGIKAETVTAPMEAEKFPLLSPPKQFGVGCYVSDTNPMHNEEFLQDVARSLPNVPFYFFGRGRKDSWENIHYMGYLDDMRDVLMKTSVNLRMAIHDGLPQTVVQYLLSGREAITNANVAYARNISMWPNEDPYAACKSRVVNEIMAAKREGERSPEEKKKVRKYWMAKTHPQKYRERIYAALEEPKADLGASDPQPSRVARGNGQVDTAAE